MNNLENEEKLFDIIICLGPNDFEIIKLQINYTKKNIIGYRNIYIVSCNPNIVIDGCITVDENIFPFNLKTISTYHGNNWRNGWYLQQLLKLYSGFAIPGILDKYLVIDADTFFLKPATFIEDGKCCYNNTCDQFHYPYFVHIEKLCKGLGEKILRFSGISHHMIFETKYLKLLFDLIENIHKIPFWQVFLLLVDPKDIEKSGASEYELYMQFMIHYHPDEIIFRSLKHIEPHNKEEYLNCLSNDEYDFITYQMLFRL